MRALRRTLAALAVALVAVAGVVLFFQSRDDPAVEAGGALGEPYRGEPVLSPALQDAVDAGNVVVLHRDARPPAGTDALQDGAGPELADQGLAVLLEREPTLTRPLAAVSAERIQYADAPEELQAFIDEHLGQAGD